ncbi:MAG TPA: ATP-binding protein [Terriglobia bacterium]|nr:ATP-binding protein [Terriglobia bacterium]
MPGAAHSDREGPVIIQALLVGEDTELGASLTTAVAPGAWSIQYAPSNAAALALAAKVHFDLIVTHEKTSGHEDIELLREIRRVSPHTRLIILTGHSTPADVITSMREHAFSYFSQPICADDLVHMILRAAEEPCWDDGIEVVSAIPDWIRTRVRCELKTADRLSQFFNEIFDLPDAERKDVARAFREILLNAVEHGGQLDPSKYVEIDYVRARHVVTCRIVDPGPGFKRDDLPHAAIANPPDDPVKHMAVREEQGMRPGGFGILVAQHLVDDLIYDEDGNEVMLVKYLDAPPESP